jgi:hypothetical protein
LGKIAGAGRERPPWPLNKHTDEDAGTSVQTEC